MPRKPDADKPRDTTVRFRLTPEEAVRYGSAATADGMTLSAWLRWLAEQRVKQQRKRK